MAGSNTIAFNTKTMNWTTEYSFSPYRFSYVGNQLVSFPQGTSNIGHLHDKNIKYNEFYGETYPSEIQVVTNENPSATKIYEAFSLESTISDWGAEFRTETGEPQEGSIASGSLVTKEGKHYKDIPKNSLNLDPTIKYVGETTIGNLVQAQTTNSIQLKGRVLSIPNQHLIFQLPKEVVGAGPTISWQGLPDQYKGIPYFYDVTVSDDLTTIGFTLTPIDEFVPELFDTYFVTSDLVDILTGEQLSGLQDTGIAPNPRFNASTNSIDITPGFFNFDAINELYQFSTEPPDSFGTEDESTQLELVSDVPVSIYTTSVQPSVNGEDMRGEYMKVKISRTGNEYYELYAINVDQHTTKLDHSLGQNN